MRISTLIIFCFWGNICFGQASDDHNKSSKAVNDFRTPYNPKGDYRTWSVKATLLPIPYSDQTMVVSALGIEYGITRNQSIGLDAHFDYSFGSHKDVLDTLNYYHSEGQDFHTTDLAAILNYRYYFNMENARNNNGLYFYTGAFVKYGRVFYYQNQLYQADFISKDENDYSEGILFGAILKVSSVKNLGLDVNIGLAHLESDVTTVYKEKDMTSGSINILNKVEKSSSIIPRIGLYLHWWFYR